MAWNRKRYNRSEVIFPDEYDSTGYALLLKSTIVPLLEWTNQ